ncbi:tRNA (adenosine(37)-N6)-dimethylallyltransferase MiaA [Anaerococcus prevotii]|uniref:tRNA (adenosine(37)-N6)-dimethylallyltransferase MiaA n=1 Tax=Anaerococcus prevotii TaxID=33034 RepID=UPI0028050547|nr:tRNA (adenosine(37)-N6)-dimethylallyltransferase MiaA [Anaerococcus prevotii]MDU2557361.1 tRNA (adenosine(37)-N6)-dimethylallyltransferase MiaA [Anaerococcus prevotii]MDU2584543.1 tRNA (adenosine(37)-N6)-dimethylallyltransferase MiaA [Anaerococcus prevotii]MDU3136287.1 tRNA (adenosine(37)-N6)-dimethylallyltransferase MiaA [Anaerococcus prevotii]
MKDRLIVITGPTASGKSDIAINLAKSLDSMIISADSQQVYRYMDIGTNKINDVFDVDHFMLNIVDPNEEFSVEDFSKEAKSLVKKINQNMRIPIVTGGTGFYIDSLIFDMNYGRVEKNQAYRDELQQVAQEKGNEYLYKKLESLDPETSKRYHHNEVNRVIRALEIYKVSGDIPSKIRTGERRLNDKVDPLVFFLNYDNRDILYNRINQRVLEMVNMGLVDEVRDLIYRFKLDSKSQSMSAIGYKEVLKYIDNNISLDEMINLIQKNTRHYAKRQITWMKKYLNYPFTYEIKMDELNKKDASDIILSVVKEVYEL